MCQKECEYNNGDCEHNDAGECRNGELLQEQAEHYRIEE